MALHQSIQKLLLFGWHPKPLTTSLPPPPPPALDELIARVGAEHRKFDERAIRYGHAYRSGFWAIYLLSAIAVLFAILPLALGWDSSTHHLHPYAGLWALGEVLIIGIVSLIYWRGHHGDWQGEWLRARTTAELIWYLPMLAPLLEGVGARAALLENNWYLRVFDAGQEVRGADEVAQLCLNCEPLAEKLLTQVRTDPQFVQQYAAWAIGILEQQRVYHQGVAARQHALLHRVHTINGWLFGLTALGALLHLAIHSMWLSLVTMFFPALGASLHGALAQTESYRLSSTSERLVHELEEAIDAIRSAAEQAASTGNRAALQEALKAAIALILEEHQDWNLLVRPHHLPLA